MEWITNTICFDVDILLNRSKLALKFIFFCTRSNKTHFFLKLCVRDLKVLHPHNMRFSNRITMTKNRKKKWCSDTVLIVLTDGCDVFCSVHNLYVSTIYAMDLFCNSLFIIDGSVHGSVDKYALVFWQFTAMNDDELLRFHIGRMTEKRPHFFIHLFFITFSLIAIGYQ